MALTEKLSAIGNAIREKTGKEELLTLEQMPGEIAGIETGGEDDLFTAYVQGDKIEAKSNSVTSVRKEAFKSYGTNNGLLSVDFPNCTSVGELGFGLCYGLTSVNLPKVETIGQKVFQFDSGLSELSFPSLKNASAWAFYSFGLTTLDAGLLTTINASLFASCSKFTTLILRSLTVVPLSNVNAFTGTPFASGGTGGTVYVPSALIAEYQTATNWATLYEGGTCTFAAIEGSEYE